MYARVSTIDQQTLPMQIEQMKEYIANRGWTLAVEFQEVGSGAKTRPKREELLKLARQRKIDVVVVWKLDRFGRSLADLITSLNELRDLGVAFISLTESLDFSTPLGRAMAGMLSTFAEFERDIIRERVIAGIANARSKGKPHGRPKTAALKFREIKRLKADGLNNSEISRRLKISRASVIGLLKSPTNVNQFQERYSQTAWRCDQCRLVNPSYNIFCGNCEQMGPPTIPPRCSPHLLRSVENLPDSFEIRGSC